MAADKNVLFIPKFEENLWKKLPTQRLPLWDLRQNLEFRNANLYGTIKT